MVDSEENYKFGVGVKRLMPFVMFSFVIFQQLKAIMFHCNPYS